MTLSMNSMDVVVLTRNSEVYLRRCLTAIFEGINVDKLIVVDGESTDNTVEIAREYTPHIYFDGGKGIACARMLGLSKARTPLFAFVDSDTVIPSGWQDKMVSFLQDDVGAVESFVFGMFGMPKTRRDKYRRNRRNKYRRTFRGKSEVELKGKYARGFTGGTILRKRLLTNLKMPIIPCYEDWVITQHILSQGFKWLKVPVFVKHFYREREKEYIGYATIRQLGVMSTTHFVWRELIREVLAGIKYTLKLKDPNILLHKLNQFKVRLNGYFHWDKYFYKKYPI